MTKEELKDMLRESLAIFEKDKESEKGGDEEEKEEEEKDDERGEELSDDEQKQLVSSLKPWSGNFADLISCMNTPRFNNGDDAAQRSEFVKILKPKYKGEVSSFDKVEADGITGCMTKLGMGKRKVS